MRPPTKEQVANYAASVMQGKRIPPRFIGKVLPPRFTDMQNSFLRADYRRAMKGSALFLSLLLTACQSVPTRDIVTKPVVLTRTVERYVPIDTELTRTHPIPEVKQPSDIAKVAAERKRALLACYANAEQIATIQGAVK